MGYRKLEHKHHEPDRSLEAVTTPGTINIENGTQTTFAIPCWYWEPNGPEHFHHHDMKRHDFYGQPTPNHPDHICQPHKEFVGDYFKPHHLYPIHLLEEGYDEVVVRTADAPEGFEASGYIDTDDDWVIRIHLSAGCEAAIHSDVSFDIAVRIKRDGFTDTAFKGIVTIKKAPIGV